MMSGLFYCMFLSSDILTETVISNIIKVSAKEDLPVIGRKKKGLSK